MTGRRPLPVVAAAAAALLALALLVLSLTPPLTAPARASTGTGGLPVTVSIGSMSPAALTPDTQLLVTGTLRNTGRTTLSSLEVVLRLDWRNLTDRRELAAWAALGALDPADGTRMVGQPLGRPLAPGESAPFSVAVSGDAVQLPVSADGFGPRGMAVEIQDAAAGGKRVGIVRSFAVWSPVKQYTPTRLALLVPVGQGRQPVDPKGTFAQVPQLWQPTGRLSRLLAATADPAFSYAVDPALLTAALRDQTRQPGRPRGAPYATSAGPATSSSTSATSGSSSATRAAASGSGRAVVGPGTSTSAVTTPTPTRPADNLFDPAVAVNARTASARLTGSLTGREVFTLPYADPDVAALGDGFRDVLDVADDEAAEVTRQILGQPLAGGLVWPAQSRVTGATAGLAADAPGRRLILPSSAAAAAEPGGTAPVHARLSLPSGQADTLFTDDALSAALAATGGSESTLGAQRLLAETAAITAAHPTESPVVLATVPRDWNPDAAGVASSLTALRAAPWLRLDSVGAALDRPAAALTRSRLATPAPAAASTLPVAHVRIIAAQLQRLERFAPVLTPAAQRTFLGPFRRSALEMTSTSWIARQRGVGPARGILTTEVAGVYQGVTVVAGSSANLLARSGQLPITIDNHLPVPVRVVLQLHPTSGRVIVKKPIEVIIEAGKSRTVRAQLQAVANGEVKIESSLLTSTSGGVPIGSAPPITIRVHYDWENRGLTWSAVALVLLLIGGLFRSVRRGRVRVPLDSVPDPDDVGREPATSPTGIDVRSAASTSSVPSSASGPPAATPGSAGSAGSAGSMAGTLAGGGIALAARTGLSRTSDRNDDGDDNGGGPVGSDDEGDGDMAADPPAAGLVSSSAIMAAGTLASRVLGVVRTVVLAWAIGIQGLSADAFSTANTLPNSLMVLIAGGVLNAVLVPQIVRAAKNPDGGKDYLDRLLTLSILVLGGATVLATALAPALVWVFAGSSWTPAQVDLATAFAVWCLPQIFFYGLYTIYGQVLNARGSFGPYMWAPVVNNIVAIAGTLVFVAVVGPGRRPPEWWTAGPVALLAGTATLGIVAQALVLLPAMRRSGYRWQPRWGWRGIGLRTAGRVAGWTFAAAAVGQIGLAFISRAANQGGALGAAQGGTTAGRGVYDNAFLLFILPHSLVAVSLVTAVFTRMSVSASAGRVDDVRADASLAVRLTGVATTLATVAIIVLSADLTRVIFVFSDRADTDALALATATMVIGLVPFSAQYLFSRVFYAFEDARTPFWIQVATVTVWAAGSTLAAATLPPDWIVPGIGLAMSVSNVVGAGLSVVVLRRRLGGLDGARVLRTQVRLIVAAVVAGTVGWLVGAALHLAVGHGRGASVVTLLVAGGVMVVGYGALLRLMRVTELDVVLEPLTRRFTRKA